MPHETPRPSRIRARSPYNTQRVPKRRPDEPPRQWNPKHAARSPLYPQTPEAFAAMVAANTERLRRLTAEGRMGRRGIPDGWAGRGDELITIRAAARVEAKQIVGHMIASGTIGEPEDPRAEEALEACVEVVRARDPATGQYVYPARNRITAANAVLAFTKARPAERADVSGLHSAEAFLAEVAEAAGRDD